MEHSIHHLGFTDVGHLHYGVSDTLGMFSVCHLLQVQKPCYLYGLIFNNPSLAKERKSEQVQVAIEVISRKASFVSLKGCGRSSDGGLWVSRCMLVTCFDGLAVLLLFLFLPFAAFCFPFGQPY
jgi:hypothetical protein